MSTSLGFVDLLESLGGVRAVVPVRYWITGWAIVSVERSGRRPYLIPAVEFTRPHPALRHRPMVAMLPVQWYRRLTPPLVVGITLFLALATVSGILGLTGVLGPASLLGGSSNRPPPGVFVGATPLSVGFDRWEPGEPALVMVGQETELRVAFTNTSPVAGDFYAAVSLKNPEGQWVDVRPLKRVRLASGAQGAASWRYAPGLAGAGTWALESGGIGRKDRSLKDPWVVQVFWRGTS